jgi:hypothetical protein
MDAFAQLELAEKEDFYYLLKKEDAVALVDSLVMSQKETESSFEN